MPRLGSRTSFETRTSDAPSVPLGWPQAKASAQCSRFSHSKSLIVLFRQPQAVQGVRASAGNAPKIVNWCPNPTDCACQFGSSPNYHWGSVNSDRYSQQPFERSRHVCQPSLLSQYPGERCILSSFPSSKLVIYCKLSANRSHWKVVC